MGELQHVAWCWLLMAGFPRTDCETSHFLLGRKKTNRTDHQPYDLYHLIPSYFGAKNKETMKIH